MSKCTFRRRDAKRIQQWQPLFKKLKKLYDTNNGHLTMASNSLAALGGVTNVGSMSLFENTRSHCSWRASITKQFLGTVGVFVLYCFIVLCCVVLYWSIYVMHSNSLYSLTPSPPSTRIKDREQGSEAKYNQLKHI
jgi:hypothetical protein